MYGKQYQKVVRFCEVFLGMTTSDAQGYCDAHGVWMLDQFRQNKKPRQVFADLEDAPAGSLSLADEMELVGEP